MIQRGDLLIYDVFDKNIFDNIFEHLIVTGERLELKEGASFFHVAIALSDSDKIEADGIHIAQHKIKGDGFKIFRPPVDENVKESALQSMLDFRGTPYDWVEIVNDAMLDLTNQDAHLPDALMQFLFKHSFICSRFGALYVHQMGFPIDMTKENIDPQFLADFIKGWMVS